MARRRVHTEAAEAFWLGLRSGVAVIESIGEADLDHAWAIGRDYADQGFSIVDRTSFAVMVRLGINRVATFDAHFSAYRYGPQRSRSFEIMR